MEQRAQIVQILLVEDNPGDVVLTARTLERSRLANTLHVVRDGETALDFLHRRGPYSDAPRPALVLLDVNLPRMSGLEVLRAIKTSESLSTIPVVMLTSSEAETDVEQAYRAGANAYLTKGFGLEGFVDVIQQFESFWLAVVQLPPGQAER